MTLTATVLEFPVTDSILRTILYHGTYHCGLPAVKLEQKVKWISDGGGKEHNGEDDMYLPVAVLGL
jgi:hypothetical protein